MRIPPIPPPPWRRVLALAALAAFLDLFAILAFVVLVGIAARTLFGEAGDALVAGSGFYVGLLGGAAAFVALAFLAGYLAVWLPGGRPAVPAHGLVVGLLASLLVALEHWLVIPPFNPVEASVYSLLGASAGWLGARVGASAVAGQEAVSRATSEINEAGDPDAIAAVVQRLLCRPDVVSVALWTPEPRDPFGPDGSDGTRSYSRSGLWPRGDDAHPSRSDAAFHPASLPVPGGFARHRPGASFSSEQLVDGAEAMLECGGRFAFLAPLSTFERGLLVFTTRSGYPFKRGVAGGIAAITSTVATKLDNFRLLAKEREHAQLQRDNAVLGERRRMAADLHDTLTQGLAAILRNAEAVHLPEDADPDSARHLEKIKREASENLKEARRLVWHRGPSVLEHKTLAEALAELARSWSDRTGVAADHHLEGRPVGLPETAVAALYRVAQEALNNVHKHANASTTRVTLSYLDDLVVLDVCDDGVGFASEPVPHDGGGGEGFGLGGMRWRLEELGGSLFVESEPGVGTSVTAELAPSAIPAGETADGGPRHGDGAASPDALTERGAWPLRRTS